MGPGARVCWGCLGTQPLSQTQSKSAFLVTGSSDIDRQRPVECLLRTSQRQAEDLSQRGPRGGAVPRPDAEPSEASHGTVCDCRQRLLDIPEVGSTVKVLGFWDGAGGWVFELRWGLSQRRQILQHLHYQVWCQEDPSPEALGERLAQERSQREGCIFRILHCCCITICGHRNYEGSGLADRF